MLCEVDETIMTIVRYSVPSHNFVLIQDKVIHDLIYFYDYLYLRFDEVYCTEH